MNSRPVSPVSSQSLSGSVVPDGIRSEAEASTLVKSAGALKCVAPEKVLEFVKVFEPVNELAPENVLAAVNAFDPENVLSPENTFAAEKVLEFVNAFSPENVLAFVNVFAPVKMFSAGSMGIAEGTTSMAQGLPAGQSTFNAPDVPAVTGSDARGARRSVQTGSPFTTEHSNSGIVPDSNASAPAFTRQAPVPDTAPAPRLWPATMLPEGTAYTQIVPVGVPVIVSEDRVGLQTEDPKRNTPGAIEMLFAETTASKPTLPEMDGTSPPPSSAQVFGAAQPNRLRPAGAVERK